MSLRIGQAVARAVAASALVLALNACGKSGEASGPASVVVAAPALSAGTYVFAVTGTDPNDGDYAVAGSFVTDGNGHVTSGVADYNLGSGIDSNVALIGSYAGIGSAVSIVLTDGKATQDYLNVTISATGSSTISSFDGTGTGTLYPQVTSGFTPPGAYTFTVSGDANYKVTGSGQLVVGSANTVTSGSLTYSDGATTASYTAVNGFLNTPLSSGRGQASLIGDDLSYYVIGPKQIVMINLDSRALLLIPAQKS